MKLLEGKTVAMIGGGGGLGRCYGIALATHGASIVVSDASLEAAQVVVAAIHRAGGKALAVQTDATQAPQIEALFDHTEAECGPLDVLLNLAGVLTRVPLIDMHEEQWDEVIATNLKSVYLGSRSAIRRMLQRGRGVILSAASGAGVRGIPNGSAYAASKAGVIAFTRSVSLELAGTAIRINCFGPGPTDTPIWRAGRTEEEIERLRRQGQVHQPDDFSNVVVFLASDFSSPLNGEFISRDPRQ